MTHEELYKQSGNEIVTSYVDGDYGSTRHVGTFTDNNPYYIQLKKASNNADKDALYELAVQWQANYFNTLEERDYNSPVNRLARDKRAGINSDILSSNGGSSASSSPVGSAIQAPQSDVEFSSVSTRAGLILDSINNACNVVSTVSSFGTATINAIKQIKLMPAEISLAESQAYIAEQTKDSVVESANLSNIHQRLSLVNQLSSYFTPESTPDDYTNVLSTLGIPADVIPQYENAIRNYHNNPAFKANYEDAIFRATERSVRNSIYTSDVLNNLFEKSLAVEQADKSITLLVQSLESSFNQYLVDNGYATSSASNLVSAVNVQSQDLNLTNQRLKRDLVSFAENLSDVRDSIHGIDARISAIAGNAKNEHRMISPTEQFEIDTLNNLRNQLMSLGSSQLQSVYSIINNANAIVYQNSEMLNTEGNPIINAASPRFLRTINTTFGNMVSSDSDIISSIISDIPFVGSIFTSGSNSPIQHSNNLSYTATY